MFTKISRYILPDKTELSRQGVLISVVGSFAAILSVALVSRHFLSGEGLPFMVASMGASAVILFTIPSSPMAKPWSLVGGHLISAFVGVLCFKLIPNSGLSVALAVSLSIFLMLSLRCLHPPGGAVALLAILGGDEIHALGYQFLLTPVAINSFVMLAVWLVFQWLLSIYNLQNRQKIATDWWDTRPIENTVDVNLINTGDIDSALQSLDSYIDISKEELSHIFSLAIKHAQSRHLHDKICGDVMGANGIQVEFATELGTVWKLFKQYGIDTIPVLDRAKYVIGVITLNDLLRYSKNMDGATEQERIEKLVTPTQGHTSDKPEVAGQLMSTDFHSLFRTDNATNAIDLFHKHQISHVIIVDESNKFEGMITNSEFNFGLASEASQ